MVAPESAAGIGLDARSLDALRRDASRDPRAASRAAAVQFEALFNQMMLKSMRDAMPSTDGGMAGENFTSMLDAQFSRQLAGRPNGLADMIEKQLTRLMPQSQGANGAAGANGAVTGSVAAGSTGAALNANGSTTAGSTASLAAQPGVTSAASSKSAGSRAADFIKRMLPHAQEAERRTGVPACYILGQAGLETGWGKCEIRNADGSTSHNLFGIKAGSNWNGSKADAMTTEYTRGVAQRQRESFRSYASYADAFSDYAQLLASRPRYQQVLAQSTTPENFATGMQRAGYATDPAYASKLARSINQALAVQRASSQA